MKSSLFLHTCSDISITYYTIHYFKLPLTPAQLHELKELVRTAAWLDQFECEAFFYATGVQSVVPGEVMNQGNLFPKTGDWYTDVRNPNIHYIGWLMHERVRKLPYEPSSSVSVCSRDIIS